MSDEIDIRQGGHCVFLMHTHLVFITQYRRSVFDQDTILQLRLIFSKVCDTFEALLVEMDGEEDHIHLRVNYPPKVAVFSLLNSLKGVSNCLLRKQRPDIANRYYKRVLWFPSYFSGSCGGASL